MANEKINSATAGPGYRFAKVDTAPGADGFATDPVAPAVVNNQRQLLNFSVRDVGSATLDVTVTLQFKCATDDEWTDYDEYDEPGRYVIDGQGKETQWRGIVKNGDYTDGIVKFGFDF